MTIPTIDTGYKPEFGLGALYQGFNAANSDQASELELIKQFLANQREQQMQPIDVSQAQQNLTAGQYKTTPEYQTGMRDIISGQGMSNLAAGQTAAGLQPFVQKEKIRESQNAFERADQQNGIYQLDNLIQVEQHPIQRMALINERNRMTRNLRETPEFTGKRELKETGTDSAEYIAELRAAEAREKANAGGKDPYIEFNKLSPEKRLGIMEWALQGGINPVTRQPLQQEELAQWQALYNQDLATYNAKLQAAQGGKVDIQTTTEGKVPTYPQASAGTTKGTPQKPTVSDTDLINKYLHK